MDKVIIRGLPKVDLGLYAHLPAKIYSNDTECPVCGTRFYGMPELVQLSHWMQENVGQSYRLTCKRCGSIWLEAIGDKDASSLR